MHFNASIDQLPAMLSYVRDQAFTAGFGPADICKIELACEELLVNIINYAKTDEVTLAATSNLPFRVKITDQGVPFNPLDVAPPDLGSGLQHREVGGLGVHLARQLLDDIQYRREGESNILTLRKG